MISEITVTLGELYFRAASFFEMEKGTIVRAMEYWIDEGTQEPPAWRSRFGERWTR